MNSIRGKNNEVYCKGSFFAKNAKSATLKGALLACVLSYALIITPAALAIPTGGQVTGGQATISSPSPGSVRIDQGSDKAILEWNSFNIGSNESVHFQQPSGGVALNRISPLQGVSQIFGQLSATGKIVLVNPSGIYFGPTARVDVGSLIASTSNISNANFMAGNYVFDQPSPFFGSVVNEGRIRAAEHGLIALIGTGVRNDGLIQARLGTVVLGAGNKFTFDFSGDQLINFTVDEAATHAGIGPDGKPLKNGISNTGTIMANGGKILMVANVAEHVLDDVINTSGIVEANSIGVHDGVIVLSGGTTGIVKVSGKINVSGRHHQQKGGTIRILGQNIAIVNHAILDASGNAGGGEILIGGDYQGKNPTVFNAENTWIDPNVTINANALNIGNGGKVIVWSNNNTFFYGNISAKGGSLGGNGGFVETSGKQYLDVTGRVNASASLGKAGVWLLDPANVTISSASTLRGSFDGGNPNTFTTTANTAIANVGTINASLNGGTSVTILTTPGGTQAGNITLSAGAGNEISKTGGGDATLTLNAAGSITLSNSITSTSGALGVTLISGNAIAINNTITTNGGNFSSTSQNGTTLGNGSGTTPGVIDAGSGTVTMDANQSGVGGQNFTMNTGSSITTTNASSSAVTINVNTAAGGTGSAVLRDITTGNGGTITVATDTGGNITGSDITQPTGTLTVGSTGTITLTNPAVTGRNIGTAGANIQISAGTLNLTTGTGGAFVTNTGTGALILGTINSTGAFSLTSTSSSSITNTGTITVIGTTTLNAGATQDITLNSSGNDFATIAITSGNNVTLVDTNGLNFGASTISGNLNVTAGGDITDSAALSVAGTATFTVGANNITLNTAMNNFNIVAINSANDVTLRDANSLELGNVAISGNLTLTTAGAVSQSVGTALTINGSAATATFIAGAGNDITLNNTGNDFTSVVITSGNNVTLNDLNALQFGAITSTISGTLNVATGGDITQLGGALKVTGTTTLNPGSHSITLDNATNDFSAVQITSANNATLRDTNLLDIGTSSIANTFTLTANNGITQSGAITVPTLIAKTLRNTGGFITLDNTGNTVNTIDLRARNVADTVNTAGAITFKNAGGFDVSTIGTTSTITLTASGIITDSGNISGGTLTTSSIGGTILDSGHNVSGFNATNITFGNIQLVNTGTLGITGISQSGGGNIDIQNAGAINVSNTIDAGSGSIALSANTTGTGGNFTMNAGSSITTTNTSSSAVAINVNAASGGVGTAVLRDITTGNGGTITVATNTGGNTTGKDISQPTGTLNTGSTGTVTLITPNITGNNIGTTGAPIQISAGTLNASTGNSGIFIANLGTTALTVNTLEAFRSDTGAQGTAQIISSGAVQQTGLSNPINVTTLTVKTLNDAGANITFNNASNSSTNINLKTRNAADTTDAPGTIFYQDTAGINISGLGTSGDATLIANGLLTDSGARAVGGTLTTTSVGGMVLNNTSQINQVNVTNSGSGNITFTNNLIPLTITGLTQSGGGAVNFSNTGDLSLANGAAFNTNGGAVTLTVTGTLSIGSGATINTGNANMTITATDLNVSGSINSGNGDISITQNTAGGSIYLGNTAGTLSITGTELEHITANNLTLNAPDNGQIIVDGITSTNSANIAGTVFLTATAGTLGTITFQNTPSSFNALTANADDQITLGTNLTTTGNLTFTAPTNGILLSTPVQLTGNGITFNSNINGTQNLTLNAGTLGDITFNADVGNLSRLGTLTITLAHDVTNNGILKATAYLQNAGNVTNFGVGGLDLTGAATVTENTVNGSVNVANLSLDTNFANLNGFVGGSAGQAAIDKIVLLNTITAGTHFFDGIDMFSPAPIPPTPPAPTPIPTPIPTPVPPLPLSVFPDVNISRIMSSYMYIVCPDDEENCPLPIMLSQNLNVANIPKNEIINKDAYNLEVPSLKFVAKTYSVESIYSPKQALNE